MKRRGVLATVGIPLLAGCIDTPFGSSGPTKPPEENRTPNLGDQVDRAEFTILKEYWDTPSPEENATAQFQEDEQTITITGTIITDGCHDPYLKSAGISASELAVTLDAYFTEGASEVDCAQLASKYRATIKTATKLPATVHLIYDTPGNATFTLERNES